MLLVLRSCNANKQRFVAVNLEAAMTLTVPIDNEEPILIPENVSSIQLVCIIIYRETFYDCQLLIPGIWRTIL